jgi:hypothetical protein
LRNIATVNFTMTLVFKKKQSFTSKPLETFIAINKIEFLHYQFTLDAIKHLTDVLRFGVITNLSFSGGYFDADVEFRVFGTLFDGLHRNTTLKKLWFNGLIGLTSHITLTVGYSNRCLKIPYYFNLRCGEILEV